MTTGDTNADESAQGIEEYTSKAGIGALWSVLGYGGQSIIRLISNLILTRLLLPEHFGLMFIVTGVLVGLELFSDIGLGPAIIQNAREDSAFLNTAWTLNVIRNAFLAVVAVFLGPVLAFIYDEPLLLQLLAVLALVVFIEGFRSTRFFTQSRKLELKRLIILEVTAQIIGVFVMVAWALVSPTVWALMAGNVVIAIVVTVLSWTWLPGISNRFRLERLAARTLFSFGAWIFLSSALSFSADYMDRFLFRFFVDSASLGVYSIGVALAAVPGHAMVHLVHGVVFPLYSRILASGRALADRYRAVRAPMLVVAGWATAGLVAGGPTIVRILYDERYWEAGWMLQAVSAGLWFGTVLSGANGAAILALGHSHWTAMISFGRLVGIALLVPLGWMFAGFPGLVIGFAGSELLRYAVSLVGTLRFGLDGRRQDAVMTGVGALSAALGWWAVSGLTAIGFDNVYLHALVIFVVVSAVWSPWLFTLVRRLQRGEKLFTLEATS